MQILNEKTRKEFIDRFVNIKSSTKPDKENFLFDIYFNEIGRLLSGKLIIKDTKNRWKTIIRKRIEQFLYKFALKRYKANKVPDKVDAFIHVNEKSHLKELLPIYYAIKKNKNIFFISIKLNLIDELANNKVNFLTPHKLYPQKKKNLQKSILKK